MTASWNDTKSSIKFDSNSISNSNCNSYNKELTNDNDENDAEYTFDFDTFFPSKTFIPLFFDGVDYNEILITETSLDGSCTTNTDNSTGNNNDDSSCVNSLHSDELISSLDDSLHLTNHEFISTSFHHHNYQEIQARPLNHDMIINKSAFDHEGNVFNQSSQMNEIPMTATNLMEQRLTSHTSIEYLKNKEPPASPDSQKTTNNDDKKNACPLDCKKAARTESTGLHIQPALPVSIEFSNSAKIDEKVLPFKAKTKSKRGKQPRPKITVLPRQGGLVYEPSANDVLAGRGGRINSFIGNVRFRQLVAQYRAQYRDPTTKKLQKAHIAANIVHQIRYLYGGKFLAEQHNGTWYEIGDAKAIRKTGQALREDTETFLDFNENTEENTTAISKTEPTPTDFLRQSALSNENIYESINPVRGMSSMGIATFPPQNPVVPELPVYTSHNLPCNQLRIPSSNNVPAASISHSSSHFDIYGIAKKNETANESVRCRFSHVNPPNEQMDDRKQSGERKGSQLLSSTTGNSKIDRNCNINTAPFQPG